MSRIVLGLILGIGICTLSQDGLASEGELTLSPVAAFSIGARTKVKDVAEMNPRAFNDTLARAGSRGEPWARSFIAIALRFAGSPPQGRDQRVTVTTSPGEWERGIELRWARVTIEDRGWLDDCVVGERWMIWIGPADDGEGFRVARGLRSQECSRASKESWFYAGSCP